jgi:hypothetical protein
MTDLNEYAAAVEKLITLQFDLIHEGHSIDELNEVWNKARVNAINHEGGLQNERTEIKTN